MQSAVHHLVAGAGYILRLGLFGKYLLDSTLYFIFYQKMWNYNELESTKINFHVSLPKYDEFEHMCKYDATFFFQRLPALFTTGPLPFGKYRFILGGGGCLSF